MDGFEVIEALAGGGFLARESGTGDLVTLRAVPGEAVEAEFRALARLRHPHLCGVRDFGLGADGEAFLVLDHVEGEALERAFPWAPERLLAVLPRLVGALDHLHRHGRVHGDVKAGGVRLLADGLPRLVEPVGRSRPDPRHSAPELLRGERPDHRADVYGLGALCYHALAGVPPYHEEAGGAVRRGPKPLRQLAPEVPAAIEAAIARLMAREPSARPSLEEALALFGLEAEADAEVLPLLPGFVGRAAELAELQAAWEGLAGVQVVAIGGSAGSGKSRLLEEVKAMARLAGRPYLACACGLGAGRPFGPFLRLLHGWLPVVKRVVAGLAGEQRAALGRLLPELGLPEDAVALEPREGQVVTQSAICHVLAGLAGAGAVLALDDWDRADAASVETLAYLQRNAAETPLLIVTTAREVGYLAPGARVLGGLSVVETATMASSLLGGGELPAEVAAALYRWTGGNPGQVQSVVAHLLRTGALERDGRRWAAPRALTSGDLAPDFLEAALAPLAALTRPAKLAAELVAVLEAEATPESLAALSGLQPAELALALAELQARHILVQHEGRLGFVSGGLQHAVCEQLTEGQLLWLHALAAMHLERLMAAGQREDADAHIALARHYVASRQVQKAQPAVLAAAHQAMARGEVETARELLQAALASPGDDARWQRDALVQLATIERWRGDFEAMGGVLDRAEPLAERLADEGPLLRLWVLRAAHLNQRMTPASLGQAIALLSRALALPVVEPLWQARGRYFLAQAYYYLGQRAAAGFAFEAAAEAAEQDGLSFWRAKSLAFLGYLQATGDVGSREQGFRRLVEAETIQARLGDRYGRCFTLALQAEALLAALRLEEAEDVLAAQLAVTQELGVGEDHVTCLANLGLVRALRGRFQAAVAAVEEALPLATAQGQTVGLFARSVGGYALVAVGELARGMAWLAEAGASGRGQASYMLLHAMPFLLEGWRWLGRPDEMLRLTEATRASWKANPDPGVQAQVAALEAEARLMQQGPDPQASVEEAPRADDAPLARIFALRLAARTELARGRLPEARVAAEALLALCEASGATALAAEAQGLCGEVALAAGGAEAAGSYRAMRLFADREGVPAMRAQALSGEALASPERLGADALQAEAEQIMLSLADVLEPLARQAFLGQRANARVVGDRPPGHAPSAQDVGQELVGRVAAVAEEMRSFAIQIAVLNRALGVANRRQAVLESLARRLQEAEDAEDACKRVLALALEATRGERALLLVGEELACRLALDEQGQLLAAPAFARAIAAKVLAGGKPQGLLDGVPREEAAGRDLDLRALMCVPLPLGRRQGLLYVDARAAATTFSAQDLAVLEALALQAGAALALAEIG